MKGNYQKIENVLIKALAVVGLLAILVVGSFTTISIARFSAPYVYSISNSAISIADTAGKALARTASTAAVTLSSVFFPVNHLSVSTDSTTVNSSEPFTLSLKLDRADTKGSYSFSYPCLEGFYFKSATAGNSEESVPCDTPFNLVLDNQKVTLTPVSTKSRYVDMPVTLHFTQDGKKSFSDKASIVMTVFNDGSKKTVTETVPKTSTINPTTSGHTSAVTPGSETSKTYTNISIGGPTIKAENPSGKADFKVSIISTGTTNKTSGAFTATSTLYRSDRIAVRFAVENTGDKTSPEWRFNAILPTYPAYTFNSDSQRALKPGERIEYTIGFDQSIAGTSTVKFIIDPQEVVAESDETNNTVSTDLFIL